MINGILCAAATALVGGLVGGFMPMFRAVAFALTILGLIGLVLGIIVIISAALMYTTKLSRVRVGSILVLIFSILSIIIGGGFIIGLILGVVGGALGLAWKPPTPPAPSPTPAPPAT